MRYHMIFAFVVSQKQNFIYPIICCLVVWRVEWNLSAVIQF